MKRINETLSEQICFRVDRLTNLQLRQISEKTNKKPSVILREIIIKSLQASNNAASS